MKRWAWAVIVAILIVGFVLWQLSDHDLAQHLQEDVQFQSGGHTVVGSLWLPPTPPKAAVALVHGDGPQDRTSSGGYAPLINALLSDGIAVLSWDKPGVGGSSGDWLAQSMADRTAETQVALAYLSQRFADIPTGPIGFSQAGWVLPALAPDDADFVVQVGAAVSWQAQGDYYASVRLEQAGHDPVEITAMIAAQSAKDDQIFSQAATVSDRPADMSAGRWAFIQRNRTADARVALSTLRIPLFAIWGAEDLNVDAKTDFDIYRDIFAKSQNFADITVWPDATHGLLKATAYNWQLVDDWSTWAKLRFILEGRYAFSPGSLDAINAWILSHTHTRPAN